MIQTLADLDLHIRMLEIGNEQDIFVSPREWQWLAQNVPPWYIVAAQVDEPPMFWFNGHRIRQSRGGE